MSVLTPIPGFPGYHASVDGRIFSTSGWRGEALRELAQAPTPAGYLSVQLVGADGKRKHKTVHSLIAATFLPPRPSPAHQVRHLDGHKPNCAASNLKWGTPAENIADRGAHQQTATHERHGMAKVDEATVAEIRRRRASGETYVSIAVGLPIRAAQVRRIAVGEHWA